LTASTTFKYSYFTIEKIAWQYKYYLIFLIINHNKNMRI
jgi:hypothetical protein